MMVTIKSKVVIHILDEYSPVMIYAFKYFIIGVPLHTKRSNVFKFKWPFIGENIILSLY